MSGTPGEFALRDPVYNWLTAQGFFVEIEVCVGSGITDIIAVKLGGRPEKRKMPVVEELLAVELKLHDVAGVVRQLERNASLCDKVYAAMPAERIQRMRPKTMAAFETAGHGLLSLSGGVVTEVVQPASRFIDRTPYHHEWMFEGKRYESSGDSRRVRLEKVIWKRCRSLYIARERVAIDSGE